jgi:hypothetical protein
MNTSYTVGHDTSSHTYSARFTHAGGLANPGRLADSAGLAGSPSLAPVTRQRRAPMTSTITGDQVVEAAQGLSQAEFTRDDVAQKLGVEKPDLFKGFKAARKSGRVEKIRDDEQNMGHFRLTDK